MYADRDPKPDPPPPSKNEVAGVLLILGFLALMWLLFYALRHGWFKTIPI